MKKILLSLILSSSAVGLAAIDVCSQVPDVEAVVKSVPKVSYPKEAKETGLEGVVTVSVDVDAAGKVTQVRSAAGPDWVCPDVTRPDVVAMRAAAIAAAEKAKFTPAMKDGQSVASQAVVKVEFVDPKPKPKDQGGLSAANVVGTAQDANGNQMALRKVTAPTESTPATGGAILSPDVGTVASGAPVMKAGTVLTADPSAPPKMVSGGVLNGKALVLTHPKYPAAARAVHAMGAVTVQLIIDEEGHVFMAFPVAGHPLLRAESTKAACSSSFSPTLLQGNPVKVSGVITYNFVP